MPTARVGPAAVVISSVLYVVGGYNHNLAPVALNILEKYDPSTGVLVHAPAADNAGATHLVHWMHCGVLWHACGMHDPFDAGV